MYSRAGNWRLCRGQRDHKCRPVAWAVALGLEAAAVCVHEFLGDRESEADSVVASRRVRLAECVEHVRQDGRVLSILASRNVDAIIEQARSLPGTSVESFPVTLKEIFLEHVRSN